VAPVRRQGTGTPSTNSTIPVKSLGSLAIKHAGFAAVLPQNGKNALFVSAFAFLATDGVYRVDDITKLPTVGLAGEKATRIAGSVTWPNDITEAPKEVFGVDGIVLGGGFLVPTKTNGGIYFSPATATGSGALVELIATDGWFYHRVIFADMDGDGTLDMVSCRAKQSLLGSTSTMLVVLKPKDATKPTGPWVETEYGAGCDALFTVADLNGDGIPEVIATAYFLKQFNVFTSSAKTGFAKPADVKKITVDAKVGAAFDVQYVDVNGDGKKDLLVSNHQGDGTGGVYAYEVPANISDPAAYVRHTLAAGFPVTEGGLNQASPGSPVAFYPTPAHTTGAPYIALAGDAAQKAYILIPGAAAWKYTTTMLHNCGGTVGKLAVVDVDGDGYAEVIIPCYDSGELAAYTFKP
jgi:hypothetical protein